MCLVESQCEGYLRVSVKRREAEQSMLFFFLVLIVLLFLLANPPQALELAAL